MVNRIENNINQSTNYVEKAKDNTEKAVTYQQKARKVSIHQFKTGQKEGNLFLNARFSLFRCRRRFGSPSVWPSSSSSSSSQWPPCLAPDTGRHCGRRPPSYRPVATFVFQNLPPAPANGLLYLFQFAHPTVEPGFAIFFLTLLVSMAVNE